MINFIRKLSLKHSEDLIMSYNKNFLSNTILRADFLDPLKEFSRKLVNLSPIIKEEYPIMEINQSNSMNIKIKDNNVDQQNISNQNIINYFDAERTKQFTISSSFMFIQHANYTDFTEFYRVFKMVLDEINILNSSSLIKRIGLRYIDEIDYSYKNSTIFDLSDVVNSKFIQPFDEFDEFDEFKATRGMSMLELQKETTRVKISYGINNPDYPSHIRKKMFVIDTDVSKNDVIDSNDASEVIIELHNISKSMFEKIIEEGLREELGRE